MRANDRSKNQRNASDGNDNSRKLNQVERCRTRGCHIELELDCNLQSISASIAGSLPENTAGGQRDSGQDERPQNFVKNYMSYGVKSGGYTYWPPYADQRLVALPG
jgi:hypothetical protein